MSRQSLRSKKISNFYNFNYNSTNTTANKQFFENITDDKYTTGSLNNCAILDKDGQPDTPMVIEGVSIGSNIGKKNAIGFNSAPLQDDSTWCIGSECCKTGQDKFTSCIGSFNCQQFQSLGSQMIGTSNYQSAEQGRTSITIGNNNDTIISNNSCSCIGNNNTIIGDVQIGFNQDFKSDLKRGLFIGTSIEIFGNKNIDCTVIGNNIKFNATDENISVSQGILSIGNNITPENLPAGEINITSIGNNNANVSINSKTVIIGNESCKNIQNPGVISIGSFSITESEGNAISIGNFNCRENILKENSILIGSGIEASSPSSLIINTFSTDFKLTPDSIAKFILRAPIRAVAHGIGVNKLHYNDTTQELTYSVN